jgi:hypothetical protein
MNVGRFVSVGFKNMDNSTFECRHFYPTGAYDQQDILMVKNSYNILHVMNFLSGTTINLLIKH